MKKKIPVLDLTTLRPFASTAIVWLGLSGLLIVGVDTAAPNQSLALLALLGFWFFGLFDLYSLARAVFAALALAASDNPEHKGKLAIQALFWGILKLGSLGLFTFVLIRHGKEIPSKGLLLGIGTVFVVPIVGGYRWSQRS